MSDAAMTAGSATRWLFLSDAHLGIRPQRRPTDLALAEFFEHVAEDDDRSTTRLVLLGDMFELLGPLGGGGVAAVERLDSLVACRSHVFAALRRCVEAGVPVDVVPGNHDLDLVRPIVAERFRTYLGVADADEAVRVWPWLYVVPGVLYAEHGNQHHDLNRFPCILDPYSQCDPDELHTPPLAARDRLVAADRFTRRRHATAVARSVAGMWWGERRANRWPYVASVRRYADAIGLDPALVLELDRLSRVRPVRTTRRIANRVLGEHWEPPDAYLINAARAVHRVTSEGNAATPLYLFGHTHVARDVLLDRSARYLNCGTWSTSLHAGDPAVVDPLRFPYVEVVNDEQGVRATLRRWRHVSSPRTAEHEAARDLSVQRARS